MAGIRSQLHGLQGKAKATASLVHTTASSLACSIRWVLKGKDRMPNSHQATPQPWSTPHPSPAPLGCPGAQPQLSWSGSHTIPFPLKISHVLQHLLLLTPTTELSVAPASQAAHSGGGSLRPLGWERGPSLLPVPTFHLLPSPEHSSPKLQAGPKTSPGPVPLFLEGFSSDSLLQSPTHTTVLGDLTIHTTDTSHCWCAESLISLPFPPSYPLSHLSHLLPWCPQAWSS